MSTTYPSISMVVGGETLTFSGEEVVTAVITEELSPISVEIPISVFEFSIISTDEDFSMFAGTHFNLLSERLPVTVYEYVDDVPYLIGRFYLDDWENTTEYTFKFKAIDIIGVLAATEFDGGFWSTATTLKIIFADVLNPIDVEYTLDASIEDAEVQGWIPPGTYRDALQQICFAGMVVASTTRSITLNFIGVSLPDVEYDSHILNENKFINQPVKLLPLVTGIELVSHNYAEGDDPVEFFSEELAIGSYKIVFEQPYFDISVTGPGYTPILLTVEGGADTITTEDGVDDIEVGGEYNFGPNSLYLNVQSAGLVTITGTPWVDSKRAFTYTEEGSEDFLNKLTLKVEDATLVSVDIAETVLGVMSDYYAQRYEQHIKLRPSEVKINDIVLTSTLYDKHIIAIVQKMSLDLTGGFLAETDVLGSRYPGIYATPGTYGITGTAAELEYSG